MFSHFNDEKWIVLMGTVLAWYAVSHNECIYAIISSY